jgi:uncharacterized protein (TIGR01777 family)
MVSVLIAGASGMIGTALHAALSDGGHHVHTLVRRDPRGPREHQWRPEAGEIDSGIVSHVDVVVSLSGASLSRIPWTNAHKDSVLYSRLAATNTLVSAIRSSATPPSLLVQGSAVGFYGDRGDESLSEEDGRGDGFLADVVVAWEGAAHVAASEKTRVAYARTGLVVGKSGAMAPLRLQTILGVGGRIGSGKQWWPWISLHDEIRALTHLITHDSAEGPFNLVGPTPATSAEITKELARLMRRPHLIGLPGFVIRGLLGEAGVALLLSSQNIRPDRLLESGFTFDDEKVASALDRMLSN